MRANVGRCLQNARLKIACQYLVIGIAAKQTALRYFFCGTAHGSVPDWNCFCRVAVLGMEVRTHAVTGNGGSTTSDVDTVASLRLGRAGWPFHSMLLRFRGSHIPNNTTLQGFQGVRNETVSTVTFVVLRLNFL